MACIECGGSSCSCDPANIYIPIGPEGPLGPGGAAGKAGSDGSNGVGIASTSYNPSTGIVTFTYTDATTFATGDLRGADGDDGAASPSLGLDVLNDIDISFGTVVQQVAAFKDSPTAKWKNLMYPEGAILAFMLNDVEVSGQVDANGYGLDLRGSGGSNLLGWGYCNGFVYNKSVGTGTYASPSYYGKFLVGQDTADGVNFGFGDTGGTKNHTHDAITLLVAHLPDHFHTVDVDVDDHTHGPGTLGGTTDNSAEEYSDDLTAGFDSPIGTGASANLDKHQHTFTVTTGSTGTIDSALPIKATGNTGNGNGSGNAFDTTTATNTNSDPDALPPYATVQYFIKI